jgi:hypothetical protein
MTHKPKPLCKTIPIEIRKDLRKYFKNNTMLGLVMG